MCMHVCVSGYVDWFLFAGPRRSARPSRTTRRTWTERSPREICKIVYEIFVGRKLSSIMHTLMTTSSPAGLQMNLYRQWLARHRWGTAAELQHATAFFVLHPWRWHLTLTFEALSIRICDSRGQKINTFTTFTKKKETLKNHKSFFHDDRKL